MRFRTKPSRIMVWISNFPVLYTTTFGGVATGNMNAQLALMAAGIIRSLGSIIAPSAAAASIGINSVVVAVLLVHSVKKLTVTQINAITSNRCHVEISESASPIMPLSPVAMNALAIQMPAPKSNNMPQGILFAVSQSSKRDPLPSGTKNSATTASKATIESCV